MASWLKSIKNITLDIFLYFIKGAKVSVALEGASMFRGPTQRWFPQEGAQQIETEHGYAYNAEDTVKEWNLTTKGRLVLKNTSKYYAYNIQLINAAEIFSTCERLPQLASLAPNESLTLEISFEQTVWEKTGQEADKHFPIPEHLKNKILRILYKNEAGTKFYTKFWTSFDSGHYEFTY